MTHDRAMTPPQVVAFRHDRCDQENPIAQLTRGIRALRCPGRELCAHWASRVRAALAGHLTAWYGVLMPHRQRGEQVVRWECTRVLTVCLRLPCQSLRAGRRLVSRLLQVTRFTPAILDTLVVLNPVNSPSGAPPGRPPPSSCSNPVGRKESPLAHP